MTKLARRGPSAERWVSIYLRRQQSAASKRAIVDSMRRVAVVTGRSVEDLPFGPSFTAVDYVSIRSGLMDWAERTGRPDLALSTKKLTLAHVRGVMRAVWMDNAIPTAAWHKLERAFEDKIRGRRLPRGHSLTKEEIKALLKTCESYPDPKGSMMRAIVLVGVGTGIRRGELCGLRVELVTEEAIVTRGKGDKENRSPLDATTSAELQSWLVTRAALPWNHAFVFATPTRGTRLSPGLLSRMVRRLSQDARLKAPIAPHDLRRTFATHMLRAGLPITVVQKLMHHEDEGTTARYDRSDDVALDEARKRVRVW
jgi:integrase/recombinase XerD